MELKGKSMEFEESSMELIKIQWNFKKFYGTWIKFHGMAMEVK